jgi:Fur family ferric uptake transcriptional regulator
MKEDLKRWEKQYGFTVSDHTFFLTGVCATCKESTSSTG